MTDVISGSGAAPVAADGAAGDQTGGAAAATGTAARTPAVALPNAPQPSTLQYSIKIGNVVAPPAAVPAAAATAATATPSAAPRAYPRLALAGDSQSVTPPGSAPDALAPAEAPPGVAAPAAAPVASLPAASGKPPVPPKQPPLPPIKDREFLSPALEILSTPASPVAMSLLGLICAAFIAAVAWSYFGWLDIHAEAPGKIQPSGRTKVVQSLEPGRVLSIKVENGAMVQAGDVLLELDSTETGADRDAQSQDLQAAQAEAWRRQAAITAVMNGTLKPTPLEFALTANDLFRQREANGLAADLAQLRSQQASLKAQHSEKQATKGRLQGSIDARAKLMALARERVGMRETLEGKGSGSRALVIDALVQFETMNTTDAGERGQLLEVDAAIKSIERKIEELVSQFIAEQTQKLSEVERKRDRLVQELLKAQTKNERTVLKAPIAGTVQQLSVTTVGQVVSSGQSLATIVPLDGLLEVEAMVANRDIGFVKVGQAAVVKIEAFPFTRYGTIDAEVIKINRDAVDQRDAPNMSDAASAARPQQQQAAQASSPQNLVFPAILRLSRRTILVDGEEINLTPGMAVTVEVKTGHRRAIDYVLSPLREIGSKVARER